MENLLTEGKVLSRLSFCFISSSGCRQRQCPRRVVFSLHGRIYTTWSQFCFQHTKPLIWVVDKVLRLKSACNTPSSLSLLAADGSLRVPAIVCAISDKLSLGVWSLAFICARDCLYWPPSADNFFLKYYHSDENRYEPQVDLKTWFVLLCIRETEQLHSVTQTDGWMCRLDCLYAFMIYLSIRSATLNLNKW